MKKIIQDIADIVKATLRVPDVVVNTVEEYAGLDVDHITIEAPMGCLHSLNGQLSLKVTVFPTKNFEGGFDYRTFVGLYYDVFGAFNTTLRLFEEVKTDTQAWQTPIDLAETIKYVRTKGLDNVTEYNKRSAVVSLTLKALLRLALKRGFIQSYQIELSPEKGVQAGSDLAVHLNYGNGVGVVSHGTMVEVERAIATSMSEHDIRFDLRTLRDAFECLSGAKIVIYEDVDVLELENFFEIHAKWKNRNENLMQLDFKKFKQLPEAMRELLYYTDKPLDELFRRFAQVLKSIESSTLLFDYQEADRLHTEVHDLLKMEKMDTTWSECELDVSTKYDSGRQYSVYMEIDETFLIEFERGPHNSYRALLGLCMSPERKIVMGTFPAVKLRDAILALKEDLNIERFGELLAKTKTDFAFEDLLLSDSLDFEAEKIYLNIENLVTLRLSVSIPGLKGWYTRNIRYRLKIFEYLITSITESGIHTDEELTLEERIRRIEKIADDTDLL